MQNLKVGFIIILNIFLLASLMGFDDGMKDSENLNKQIVEYRNDIEKQQYLK